MFNEQIGYSKVYILRSNLFFILVLASIFLLGIISIGRCDPGISVTVVDVDPFIMGPSEAATYTVNTESLTTEDENVKLMVSGDPNLNFDWTTQEFLLLAGDTQSFGLEATVTTPTAGDYEFTVLGEAWPLFFTYDEASMMGLIETSSYTDHVHVMPTGVIPEVPLGTVMAGASMIAALVAYITVPRFRRRQ